MKMGYPSPDQGRWPDHPDRAFSMEGSWRIAQGQVPHRDFSTVVGPAWIYGNALSVMLVGSEYARAMPLGIVMMLVLLSGLALAITLRRSIPVIGMLSVFYIAEFLTESPFLEYNGVGYIFFWLILLEAFTPPERSWKNMGWITGALLGVLLFWKLNFFLAAVVTVSLLPLVISKTRHWALSVMGGFVLAAMFFLTLIRWHVGAWIHDLSIPFMVKTSSVLSVMSNGSYHLSLLKESWWMLVGAGIVFLWAWSRQSSIAEARWKHWLKGGLLLTVLLALQNFLVMTNARPWAAEAVPWLIILAWTWGMAPTASARGWWNSTSAIGVMGLLSIGVVGVFWWPVFRGSVDHVRAFAQIRQQTVEINDQTYWASVKDGIVLLEQQGLKKSRS